MLDTLGIGPSLREARIRRGIELDRVEAETRIRTRYLEAIEDDRWDELPAEAYAKGFLRTYAAFLELDPQQFLAAFRDRRREVAEPIAPQPEHPYEPWRVGARTLVAVAGALAAVLAVAAWQLDGGAGTAVVPRTAAPTPRPTAAAPAAQAAPRPTAAPKPLLLTARDDAWVEIRFAGPRGKLVWAGTLRRGRTLRLGLAKPLWLRVGRPAALAAAIGRRAVPVPEAPTFVATPGGLRVVRA